MCGRYTETSPAEAVRALFDLEEMIELPPRWNVAPTQEVPVVRVDPEDGRRELLFCRWGLVPFFAGDPKIGARLINARAETADTKPAFRAAFKRRRCLLPADGFYEWTGGKPRRPFHIRRKDRAPYAMAGLYETWRDPEGRELLSCTILTCEANEVVRPFHDRMPVILDPSSFAPWLHPDPADPPRLKALLVPFPAAAMEAVPADPRVNDARNEGPF